MNFSRVPYFVQRLFVKRSWRMSESGKSLYLTFDDGPTPEITQWVLKTLKEKKAKATFFCTGKNVVRHPDIFQQILNDGHSVGNHTYSHLNGWKTKRVEYFNDVQLAGQYIHSDLFRPPYGKVKPSQIHMLLKNYRIIMWDVLSGDYDEKVNPAKCLHNVLSLSKPGSIIVFHDTEIAWNNLEHTLPKVLDKFHNKGYCFRAIK